MTTDATIEATVNDVEFELEMEELLANRPQFRESVPGTEGSVEPLKSRSVTSTAAIRTIYNRETGESSEVSFDALRARMRQKFPEDYGNPRFAGQRVYDLNRENVPQVTRGHLACPLRYDNPDEDAIALGFGVGTRVCKKPAYFLTEYDVEMHVEKNHKRFYELRERRREEAKQQEQMDLQRQMIQALSGGRRRGAGNGAD